MYAIYHDVFIKSTKEKVFEAVSDSKKMIHWWPQKCSGEAKNDCIYNLFFTQEYDWYGKATNVKINESFYVKMTEADADWDPTTFGYEIDVVAGGINLRFSHVGWPECNHHYRRSSYCWAILLKGLKDYLEVGTIVPFEKRG